MQFHGVFQFLRNIDLMISSGSLTLQYDAHQGGVIYVAVFTIFQNGHIDKFGHTRVGHVGQSCYFLKVKTDNFFEHLHKRCKIRPPKWANLFLTWSKEK